MGIGDKLKGMAESIKDKAEDLVEDAKELKDVATGEGSLADKAKAAVEAVKDPGKPGE